jgi:predicted dehydrogenase
MAVYEDRLNMTQDIRIGLIGCGGIGADHASVIQKVNGARIVAYCDVHAERADLYLNTYGGDYSTTDVSRILSDPNIDVVYVLTQHDSHADLCVRAATNGKHILVEKPLALSVEDCLRVGRAVRQHEIKLMTGFKMRYYELVQRVHESMPKPLVLTMQMMDNRWQSDIWANDPIKGGGNVLSQGCHACDLLRFLARSDPLEVHAIGGNFYQTTGVIDNVCATFKFANGVIASWVQGDCRVPSAVSKFYLQAFEQDRSICLTDRFTRMVEHTLEGITEIYSTETGLLEENRAFIYALQNKLPAPIDHRDGLYATLMVLQAFKSIQSGRSEPIAGLLSELD